MASRNGLNPKIKAPKGVGFGRALPAPFGFGNGISADGVNDYMTIPGMISAAFPIKCTVEFWTKKDPTFNSGYIFQTFETTTGYGINAVIDGSSRLQRFGTAIGVAHNYTWPILDDNLKTHMVLVCDQTDDNEYGQSGSFTMYVDGLQVYKAYGFNSSVPTVINTFELFRYTTYGAYYSSAAIDEFRFYDKTLRLDQIQTNYNNRIGNNPCETENLLVWYNFEQFETLDFSILQDGSDMRLGIRDLSGKNNHALPFNMDTNSTSGTYVIKPF